MSEEPLERRLEAAQQRETWRQSPEFKKAQRIFQFWFFGGVAMSTVALLTFLFTSSESTAPISTFGAIFFILIAVLLFYAFFINGKQGLEYRHERFQDARLLERYEHLTKQQSKLLDEDRLKLGELWRLSEERIRAYHEIATRQANASFRNAQRAISAGFLVIIVGSGVVFFARSTATAVVVGVLGGAGAALSAYIGKTFLRLQENAASHLRSYFDQPREQFRYLAAERLLSHLGNDDQRAAAITEIIKSIASSNPDDE